MAAAIRSNSHITLTPPRKMTMDAMQKDFEYRIAEKIVDKLLKNGLLSDEESSQINALNIKSFTPYMAELMT